MVAHLKAVGVLVGAAVFFVGLLMTFSVIPGAAVVGPTGTDCYQSIPNPGCVDGKLAVLNINDYTVTVQDQSTTTGNGMSLKSLTVAWNDPVHNVTTVLAPNGNRTATHTYTPPTTGCKPTCSFTIIETVVGGDGLLGDLEVTVGVTVWLPLNAPPAPCTSYCLLTNWSYDAKELTVIVTDHTTTSNLTSSLFSFSWGDGSSLVTLTQGGNITHTYAKSGNYTATELAQGVTKGGKLVYSNSTAIIRVLSNGTGYGSSNTTVFPPTTAPSHSGIVYNWLTALLLWGGPLLAALVLVGGNIPIRISIGVGLTVVGFITGGVIGGF